MNENQNVFDTQLFLNEKTKFRQLAVKYGISMILMVLNHFFAPYFFVMIAVTFFGVQEFSYPALLILNEVSAYLFPSLIFFFMFKDECKVFTPDKTYTHIFAEPLFIFAGGMALGMSGSLITRLVNSVIDGVFGTGEIPDAFSGVAPQNMGEFGIFAFCICIVAPVAEEIIFRCLLLKPLRTYGDLPAAIITGILFGLYHGNFDQLAYASILGIFCSVIAIRYNSIIPTIILHSLNNLIVTFSGYLSTACQNESESVRNFCNVLSAVCENASLILVVLGIAGIIICLCKKCFVLHNHNRFIPPSLSFATFISTPVVIAGVVAMFIPFFKN